MPTAELMKSKHINLLKVIVHITETLIEIKQLIQRKLHLLLINFIELNVINVMYKYVEDQSRCHIPCGLLTYLLTLTITVLCLVS